MPRNNNILNEVTDHLTTDKKKKTVKVKVLTYVTHITIIKLENKLQANVYLLSKQNMKQTRAFQNINKIV